MKILKKIITAIILVPILIWAAFGPGMRLFLDKQSGKIIERIRAQSDDHIIIGSLSGDLWSGIRGERVVIYTDKDPSHLPLLSADTVIFRLSLLRLLKRDITPYAIHIAGFNAILHIDKNGDIALPEWKLEACVPDFPVHHAGFAFTESPNSPIRLSWERGVIEILKRFPNLSEMVDVVLYHLQGSGNYVEDEGFQIIAMTGDYLGSPVTLGGYIPSGSSAETEITATIENVQLKSLFRDIDPLFRGNSFLPTGNAGCNVEIMGTKGQMNITGALQLTQATMGNVTIDSADTSISYSAGIVDLTQIDFEVYGGHAEATARINLLSETPLWNAVATFEDVDLPAYLDANGYYSYELDGKFDGMLDARGDFASRENLSCTVDMTSDGGKYLTPFSARFMNMAQGAKDDSPITPDELADYTELISRLNIQGGEIWIERFHFVSDDLQVEGRGAIGFDKAIRASGGLSVPLTRARQHPRFGRFVVLLPDTMDRASLEFTISGYLYDLEFSVEPTENLLRGLLDQGSDLFHGLGDSFRGNDSPSN